uniref:Uncharacterized protein n=1 Tax=Megaselia scalaris TaxID=36166 RepID=T1H0V9_MEGSC
MVNGDNTKYTLSSRRERSQPTRKPESHHGKVQHRGKSQLPLKWNTKVHSNTFRLRGPMIFMEPQTLIFFQENYSSQNPGFDFIVLKFMLPKARDRSFTAKTERITSKMSKILKVKTKIKLYFVLLNICFI